MYHGGVENCCSQNRKRISTCQSASHLHLDPHLYIIVIASPVTYLLTYLVGGARLSSMTCRSGSKEVGAARKARPRGVGVGVGGPAQRRLVIAAVGQQRGRRRKRAGTERADERPAVACGSRRKHALTQRRCMPVLREHLGNRGLPPQHLQLRHAVLERIERLRDRRCESTGRAAGGAGAQAAPPAR